jgi:hypothetical protein
MLGRFRALVSDSDLAAVKHYLDIAEVEMAGESLVLSLMESSVQVDSPEADSLIRMCLALGLDESSVFREDFWAVAQPWLKARSSHI